MVILVLMLGTANKLKSARQIALTGAVSGSTNFDGSGNVTITTKQANIAVITGSTTTTSDSLTATTKVNYPNGYNVNNCVVISIMGGRTVGGIDYPWTTSLGKDSSSYLLGCAELGVSLDSDGITVRRSKISNSEPVSTKKFKLVLMKVS